PINAVAKHRHLRLYRLSRHPLYSSIATSVGRTAGSGDPRRTKGRTAGSGDPRRTEPEVPSAKSVIAISNVVLDQGAGSVRTSSPATLRKWLDDASAFSTRMRMRIVWGPGGRPRCVQSKGRF